MDYIKLFLVFSLIFLLYKLNQRNETEEFKQISKHAKTFKEIGEESGTDKIYHHGYDRFYPLFLNNLRNMKEGMLEIGIDKKASLKLWLEYFPSAFIYGLDIDVEMEQERVKVFKADQSSLFDLMNVKNQITHPIKFIIDDGSHIPEHQLLTFDYLFQNLLVPGGIYIVEDIEVSYWTKNGLYGYPSQYGYKNSTSFIEHAKSLVDTINKEFLDANSKSDNQIGLGVISTETSDMISSMTFGYNCVIFVKKTKDEMKYLNRPYAFSHNL